MTEVYLLRVPRGPKMRTPEIKIGSGLVFGAPDFRFGKLHLFSIFPVCRLTLQCAALHSIALQQGRAALVQLPTTHTLGYTAQDTLEDKDNCMPK